MDDSMSSWLTNAYVCVRAHDDEPLPRLQLHEHQGDLDEADGGHRAQHIDHWKFPLIGKLRCIVIEEFHQPLGGRAPLGLQDLITRGLLFLTMSSLSKMRRSTVLIPDFFTAAMSSA